MPAPNASTPTNGKWTVVDAKRHILETGHSDFQVTISPYPFDWMMFKCLECGIDE